MPTPIIYLTAEEEKALRLLALGCGSRSIIEQCDVGLSGIAIFTQKIRRKTGIADHKEKKQCEAYLERYERAMVNPVLSDNQLRALRMLTNGDTMEATAYRLEVSTIAEATAILDSALEAAGIFTHDPTQRKLQARLFLAAFYSHPITMSKVERQILKQMAEGKHFLEIAEQIGDPVKYVKERAASACRMLGFSTQGRNTQRNLLRAYFAQHDRQMVTMEDPMF